MHDGVHCTVASVLSQGRDGMDKGIVCVVMSALSSWSLPEVFEDEVWASLSLSCSCRTARARCCCCCVVWACRRRLRCVRMRRRQRRGRQRVVIVIVMLLEHVATSSSRGERGRGRGREGREGCTLKHMWRCRQECVQTHLGQFEMFVRLVRGVQKCSVQTSGAVIEVFARLVRGVRKCAGLSPGCSQGSGGDLA